jgi:hypothetical protein
VLKIPAAPMRAHEELSMPPFTTFSYPSLHKKIPPPPPKEKA